MAILLKTFRFKLVLIIGSLAGASLMVAISSASISPGMGNGGAFMGASLVALATGTALAWCSAGISFMAQESMRNGFLCHFAFPLSLASPGACLLIAAAWRVVWQVKQAAH